MKISEFAKKITAESNNIKIAFGGEAGSGKTFTAVSVMIGAYLLRKLTKPILYLDTERGSKFMMPLFEKAGITEVLVKQTDSLNDVLEAFSFAEKGETDFIFIDSLSRVYQNFVESYKKKSKVTFMSLLHWGRIIPLWNSEFTDRYVKTNNNIIFTGRGGYTWSKDTDTKNDAGITIEKGQMHRDGVKLKLPTEAAYEPDFIVWMTGIQTLSDGGNVKLSHQAQILKDRSNLLDGKSFENPTFKDFKPYIDFLTKLSIGDVATSISSATDLIPVQADKEYWERHERKEILLEQIKGIFEKFGVTGTSKDAKQINALIAEKIFGTTSWKEVEVSPNEKIELFLNDLSIFFSNMDEKCLADKDSMIAYIKSFNLKVV